jgi:hypothetical protein
MEQCMRFLPSLSGVVQFSVLLLFTSNLVDANHRSRTAPGADDPDSGRGLGLSKEHGAHEAHYEAIEFSAAMLPCFKGEDANLHAAAMEHDRLRDEYFETESDNRRLLRAGKAKKSLS